MKTPALTDPSRQSPPVPWFGDLSVVVCARNESKTIQEVLRSLRQHLPGAQLIVVDNGSTDATGELAQRVPGTVVVTEPLPGKGHAMRAGAAAAEREWLLFHDGDGEYRAEDCPDVVLAALQNGAWAVGTRATTYGSVLPSSIMANWLARALIQWRTGQRVDDVLTGTRCIRRSMFLALRTNSPHFGIETEISRKLCHRGLAPAHAPVRFVPRTYQCGKKIRPWHLMSILVQAVATKH